MMSEPWTEGPWRVGRLAEEFWGLPIIAGPDDGADEATAFYICGMNDDLAATSADGRLIVAAPELFAALEKLTGWLEGTDEFQNSHGVHSDTVEARKLLDRVRGNASG